MGNFKSYFHYFGYFRYKIKILIKKRVLALRDKNTLWAMVNQ